MGAGNELWKEPSSTGGGPTPLSCNGHRPSWRCGGDTISGLCKRALLGLESRKMISHVGRRRANAHRFKWPQGGANKDGKWRSTKSKLLSSNSALRAGSFLRSKSCLMLRRRIGLDRESRKRSLHSDRKRSAAGKGGTTESASCSQFILRAHHVRIVEEHHVHIVEEHHVQLVQAHHIQLTAYWRTLHITHKTLPGASHVFNHIQTPQCINI